jgi:hypothetical protein
MISVHPYGKRMNDLRSQSTLESVEKRRHHTLELLFQ